MSAGATAARTDVAVVGAGPTGLTLACALAARGVDVVILDRAVTGHNTSRAGVVHARTLEVLEDIDVTSELLDRGIVVPSFTIKDRDRTLLTVPFDRLPTRYPFTLMCPQDITERVLENHLSALGGRVHREHAVTGVEIDGNGATARGALARGVRNVVINLVGQLPPVRRRIAMTLSELSTRPDSAAPDPVAGGFR